MCGRFTIAVSNEQLEFFLSESFGISGKQDFHIPRYNVAPGQGVIAVINDGHKHRVGLLHWGFVPPFAKDEKIGYSMINARAETIMEKPSFKPSFKTKRCLIIADSFFEWKKENNSKKPYRFLMEDRQLFTMAGLYTTFIKKDGSKLHSCTIVTTQANHLLKDIHERMPVILDEKERQAWLDPKETDLDYLHTLLKPYVAPNMIRYQVSQLVNQAQNDSEECIKSV